MNQRVEKPDPRSQEEQMPVTSIFVDIVRSGCYCTTLKSTTQVFFSLSRFAVDSLMIYQCMRWDGSIAHLSAHRETSSHIYIPTWLWFKWLTAKPQKYEFRGKTMAQSDQFLHFMGRRHSLHHKDYNRTSTFVPRLTTSEPIAHKKINRLSFIQQMIYSLYT